MLKDLFMSIWNCCDEFGWPILIVILSVLCLAFSIFAFCRTKAKNEPFTKKHFLYLAVTLVVLSQLVPITFDLQAFGHCSAKKSAETRQKAVNTSIIPWQKGLYYIRIGETYANAKNLKDALLAYDKAYTYINSYEYPCWRLAYFHYYLAGEYDKAIEMGKVWRHYATGELKPAYHIIAPSYLMKGDLKNAEINIDKAIEIMPASGNYAIKAYILKITGRRDEAERYYYKALSLCKDKEAKEYVERTYDNFVLYEKQKRAKFEL